MPGYVSPANPVTVLPKALSTIFSSTLDFPNLQSIYKSGEYQALPLVQNERRSWKQQRRLAHTEADALMAFYRARGGAAEAFWFYDPLLAAGEVGTNWDATGAPAAGRFAVRFEGPMKQAMNAPGRLTHDFALRELYTLPVAASLHMLTSQTEVGVTSPVYDISLVTANRYSGSGVANYVLVISNINGDTWTLVENVVNALTGTGTGQAYRPGYSLEFTLEDAGPPAGGVVELLIYDVSIDLTFGDGSVRTVRPHTASVIDPGGLGTNVVINPGFAVDGNPATCAILHMDHWDPVPVLSLTSFF